MDLHEFGGINPIQPATVNAAQARSFLSERFRTDINDVTSVGKGEWSTAFTYSHLSLDYVIRFSAHEEDFAKDRWVSRFASAALPIPRVTDLGEALGCFYAISERAHGCFIDTLDAAEMRAMLPALFTMLDAARRADVSDTAGYGTWGMDGSASHATWAEALLDVFNDRPTNRVHGWRDRMAASSVGTGPFEQAFNTLKELAPETPVERHLIHSDLMNYNVLVDNSHITAVIDWGCAMYERLPLRRRLVRVLGTMVPSMAGYQFSSRSTAALSNRWHRSTQPRPKDANLCDTHRIGLAGVQRIQRALGGA